MPCYDYFCPVNGQTVEVRHPADVMLNTWGELCYVSQHPLGDTDCLAPVQRVLRTPPRISAPISNTTLKELGFTKLVRRDKGVYENVTALDDEARYVEKDKPDTLPRIDKKVED